MKNIYKILLLSIFGVLLLSNSFSQNIDFKKENFPKQSKELRKAQKNIRKGDNCFSENIKGKYAYALDYFLLANSFNPNNALLNYKIGVCYLKSFYKNNALIYLENAYKLDSKASPFLDYYLGLAYQYNYMFDEAIAKYRDYASTIKNPSSSDTADVNKKIRECNYGKEFYKNSNKAIIENLGGHINSMWDDYSPIVNRDETELAFTSRRKDGMSNKINYYDFMYYEDIYFIFKNADGTWTEPINPGKPLNNKYNNATIELSQSGDTIMLYQNKSFNEFLFESHKIGSGQWSKPVKLVNEINLRSYYQPSATYTNDRKTIYFISDRPGGFGGTDIYICKKDANGKWGQALNLGPEINTSYDEDGAHLLNDSILYFSSKGHNSMGGYDIFITKLVNGKWTIPVNIGYPMNSTGEDIFLTVAKSGNGYFSSDRQGGFGGLDNYYVNFNMTPDEIISQVLPVYVDGNISDEKTNEPVLGSVNILDSLQRPYNFALTDSLGHFVTSLTSGNEFYMNINLKGCYDALMTGIKKFGVTYTPEYQPLVDNNKIKPTLIYGYVIDDKKFQPLQPKIEVIDVKSNKIVATIIPDTLGKFSITLPSSMQYIFNIKTNGCEHKKVIIASDDINYAISNYKGHIIKLENVYFDFDKHYIRPDAAEILNRHAELFLKNPDWKIILKGHTDNMGSDSYNNFLSKKRAESVKDYLMEKGLKRNRFKMEGFGFTQSIATNATPQGRQLNRRVEFYIKK